MISADTYVADLAACRALIRTGSHTFHAASKLLPRKVADPAIALYAFCRLADDAVDLGRDRTAAVARLRERLDRVCRGQPMDMAADRAFAGVMARYVIPRALPEALLEGLAWDATSRRYESLEELYDYAARVAGSVGAMMSLLMGRRAPETVARACELGVAMQLTNIARDVGEDARAGRLYLPLGWLREARIDPDAWLAAPTFTPAIGMIVQRLLDAADVLYERATAGIVHLPASCRPGIYAARALYAEIGREVERNEVDSVSLRAVVPTRRKLSAVARAWPLLQSSWASGNSVAQIAHLEEICFLIDAVAKSPVPDPRPTSRPRPIEDRVIWVIDLFARLERRDQFRAGLSR